MRQPERARKKKPRPQQTRQRPGILYHPRFEGIQTEACITACLRTKVTGKRTAKYTALSYDLKMQHPKWDIRFRARVDEPAIIVTFLADSPAEVKAAAETIRAGIESFLKESLTLEETVRRAVAV